MSEIKLFRLGTNVIEVKGTAMQIERSLQRLFEENLEALLGVTFLASEYSTGPAHGGRIDTLGIDEDGSPVIIEYKRSINENVVSQGLFYLDWLLDHRKEFQWLVLEKLGHNEAKMVEWSAPRLLCIAGDFTRYDEHAVKQIARNIELLRYRRFDTDLLMIELVHVPKQTKSTTNSSQKSEIETSVTAEIEAFAVEGGDNDAATTGGLNGGIVASEDKYKSLRLAYRLSQSSVELSDIYSAVKDFLLALGDDVQVKELVYYTAFKRIKNFVCLEIYPQAKVVTAFLRLNPDTVSLEKGFTRDVTKIGHYGTGNLEITMRTMADFTKAQSLFLRSYEGT